MYCDVYKWKGHHYDNPLYNDALNNIEVVKKCRCGKMKSIIRYIPLPDTVESQRLLRGYSPSELNELFTPDFYSLLAKDEPILALMPLIVLFTVLSYPFKQLWIFIRN